MSVYVKPVEDPEVDHKCDDFACKQEADSCFCAEHLDAKLTAAYDEGFHEGQVAYNDPETLQAAKKE